MVQRILIVLFLLLTAGSAKELQIVFSYSTPPFVFPDGSGIVQTIVKEALSEHNYSVKPVFVNMGRGFEMFKEGYVDGTSIIRKNSDLDAFYSDYFMQYHNVLFALSKHRYNIRTLDDLKDFNLIAFQNAHRYLGEAFGAVAESMGKRYSEIADQKQQVLMLLKGRTDLIVMDRFIFTYYRNELIREQRVEADIGTDMFELFEPTRYRTAFKSQRVRDAFDEGIKHLRESGRIDAIYKEYSERYFEVQQ